MDSQRHTDTTLRVLCVDDCAEDVALVERELARGGYKPVITRVDGPCSMNAALREGSWDVVLADWTLSQFSAVFALEMLKCHGLDLPFIIVSGAITEETAVTAMKAGARDYVMKSNLTRLATIIERELQEAGDRLARKYAEEAAAASEQRMELVVRATHDAIWDWDMASQTCWWGKGLESLFGYRLEAIPTGLEFWFGCLHPDEKDRVIMMRYAAINGEGDRWADQYRFRRADGTYAHVLDRGYVVRNNEGLAVRAVGALIDLTEQRRAEAEIAAAYARLRDVTVRLERTKEEERKRIARELHDEFGQLLTGLKLDLAALGKQLAKDTPAARPKAVEKLRSLTELVDDSIHLVRKVASSLRPSILDDLGLLPALQWQAREFEARAGIPCELAAGPGGLPRDLDPDRSTALFRIAQELLTNIMRHARATRVRMALREEEQGVLLEVSDNGRGIAEREWVNPTTLGLRGLQERVALFGGTLQFTGEPGRGTTVRAWMPLELKHAEKHTEPAAAHPGR